MINKHLGGALLLMGGCVAAPASAALVTYDFSFSAEDILTYWTYQGGYTSGTAADNGIDDGARLIQFANGYTVHNWIDGEYPTFESYAYFGYLSDVQLWGFGGDNAATWGEEYLHVSSDETSAPTNWLMDWPGDTDPSEDPVWNADWGTNPNADTDETVGWYTNTTSDTFSWFGNEPTDDDVFSFQMTVDSDYLDDDDSMVFWFKGTMSYDYGENGWVPSEYQGNIRLTGTEVPAPPPPPSVPAPAPLWLLASGLIGMGVFSRRRSVKD